MYSQTVKQALERLRIAADSIHNIFPKVEFQRVHGPGPATITLHANSYVENIALESGQLMEAKAQLNLPESLQGIVLAGQPLVATLNSFYPVSLRHNDKLLFEEGGVPVACGPALFEVIEKLTVGDNGTLHLRLQMPSFQATQNIGLRLSTPSIRAAFEQVDIAWAQLAWAGACAESAEQQAAVERAAACVPQSLLPWNQAQTDHAFAQMTAALAPLAEVCAQGNVHVIGHSHIDMNWLWTWPDTQQVILRDVRSVLGLMDEFPNLTFSHSQAVTYEVIRQQAPDMFAKILKHIASGRWEVLASTWVEGDVNMASGEAHARQFLQGCNYSRSILGVSPKVLHDPDTFGHAGNLPQLAVAAGLNIHYHHRSNPNGVNLWPAYWWEGDDGTRILSICTSSYNGEIFARDLAIAAIRAKKWGHSHALHFHGIGDHGGGPSRQNLQSFARFVQTPFLPPSACSTLEKYAQGIGQSNTALPIHCGETSTIFEGCYTTHADTKRYNRHGENLLCTADTLAAVSGVKPELTEAWRHVLFNQFHDILDGSAIHESYEKNQEDFQAVHAAAKSANAASLAQLCAGAAAGDIVVTNPLGFERNEWVQVRGASAPAVRDETGRIIAAQQSTDGIGFVARVGPFDSARYQLHAGPVPQQEKMVHTAQSATETLGFELATEPKEGLYLKIETNQFRILLRKDCGILVSFFDKRVARELVSFGTRRASDYLDSARPDLALNVFQVLEEHPHGMNAWQIHEVHQEQSLLRGAVCTVLEDGPQRAVIQMEHSVRESKIRQHIIFYRELPRVDFQTWVDWREIGDGNKGVPNLKVAFTARLSQCQANFETPFAAARRPADGQESPALRWADIGGPEYGFALLNESKYGYDALGCRLRLSLLRSAYDPDAISDAGEHQFRYAFYPHAGDWADAQVVRQAAAFNQPLLVRQLQHAFTTNEATYFRPVVDAPHVEIACIKHAEMGGGRVIRLYESAGKSAVAQLSELPEAAQVYEADLLEIPLRPLPVKDGAVEIQFAPWQVKTLLVRWRDA